MTCHLGDFTDYASLRRRLAEVEKDTSREVARRRRSQALASLEGCARRRHPGARWAALGLRRRPRPGHGRWPGGARPTVLTADRDVRRLSLHDVPTAVEPVATVRIPKKFNPRNPAARRDLASSLRAALTEGRLMEGPPDRRSRAADAEGDDTRSRETEDEAVALRRKSASTRATGAPSARTTRGGPTAGPS